MKIKKKKKLISMLQRLNELISIAKKFEKKFAEEIKNVHLEFQKSAINLVHYIALRTQDISDLQDDLGDMGISRIGKSESHVMASLIAVRKIIMRLLKQKG